ncbi:hypothetical protein MMC16_006452 [Acarospora aff. strigata]|nr:hypothetical protein [Acarospora aff. strigata]
MRRLSGSQQESLLPRHQQQVPIAGNSYYFEALIPHSLTTGPMIDSVASFMASSQTIQNPLLALERKERQLQRDLQALLDAQSEGLIAGLSGAATDDATSNGTRTPSTSGFGEPARRTVPVRQPIKKKLTLHGARRRILSTIQELSVVKGEESRILEAEATGRDVILEQVEGFGKKRDGLEQEIAGIEGESESRRVSELKDQARAVEIEIHEVETKLLQMRAMHRHLTAQISELDNSVQAKLSSYKASLSIVDSQVKRFLARPPLSQTGFAQAESSFLSLPPQRRTLQMAKDHWSSERDLLRKKRDDVGIEKDALEDGAVVWQDVVSEIHDFEKRVQEEVRRLSTPGDQSMVAKDGHAPLDDGMREVLDQMDPVIAQVESKLKLAETRDWKLLVCCIGAELEALKEGRSLLQGTLAQATHDKKNEASATNGLENGTAENIGSPRKPAVSQDYGLQEHTSQPSVLVEGLDEEDDEPDPELLISHQDTD